MILGSIFDPIQIWGKKVVIGICNVVYKLIDSAFQVFLFLTNAGSKILDDESASVLLQRIYEIFGVVMLFILAYNLLLYIANPDKNSKMDSSGKTLIKFFTTIVLVFGLPFLFKLGYEIQDSGLQVIAQLFSTEATDTSTTSNCNYTNNEHFDVIYQARKLALSIYYSFWTINDDEDTSIGESSENGDTAVDSVLNDKSASDVKNTDDTFRKFKLSYNGIMDDVCYGPDNEKSVVDTSAAGNATLSDAKAVVLYSYSGSYDAFKAFAGNWQDGELEFSWLLAIIAGIYFCYVITSFTFDLALRAVKLAFLQIIAPICVICRILPQSENIFNSWKKETLETYFLVYVRMFSMTFGLYMVNVLISGLGKLLFDGSFSAYPFKVWTAGKIFLILGLVTFIKQAPKYIGNLFGLKGDIHLGITPKQMLDDLKGKFAAGGGYVATSFIAGAARGISRDANRRLAARKIRRQEIDKQIAEIKENKGYNGMKRYTDAEVRRRIQDVEGKWATDTLRRVVTGTFGATVSGIRSGVQGGRDGVNTNGIRDAINVGERGAEIAEENVRIRAANRSRDNAYRASHSREHIHLDENAQTSLGRSGVGQSVLRTVSNVRNSVTDRVDTARYEQQRRWDSYIGNGRSDQSLQQENDSYKQLNDLIKAVSESGKNKFIKDANDRKAVTYGIKDKYTYTGKDEVVKDIVNKAGLTMNYNSGIYRNINDAIDTARTQGKDSVTYEFEKGKFVTMSINQWNGLLDNYASEAGKQMGNVAGANIDNFDAYAANLADIGASVGDYQDSRNATIKLHDLLHEHPELVDRVNEAISLNGGTHKLDYDINTFDANGTTADVKNATEYIMARNGEIMHRNEVAATQNNNGGNGNNK